MKKILNKARYKVIEWGGFICGLINEDENNKTPE